MSAVGEATTALRPCPTCGRHNVGLAVEISPMNRALLAVGGERSAITTAYRMFPDAPRDLVRAIVRYVRSEEAR